MNTTNKIPKIKPLIAMVPPPEAKPTIVYQITDEQLQRFGFEIRDGISETIVAAPKLDIVKSTELQAELKVSPATLMRLRDAGMPYFDLGGNQLRYSLAAVREWLALQEKREVSNG